MKEHEPEEVEAALRREIPMSEVMERWNCWGSPESAPDLMQALMDSVERAREERRGPTRVVGMRRR